MTRSRRQFHPVVQMWEDLLGPTAAQCLPGPRDLNTIGCTVVNGVANIVVMGLRDVTTRQGLVIHLDVVKVGSGPMSSSEGSSSRSKQADSMDRPGSGRALGRATDVQPSSDHL